jgi:hypothetical protein
MPTNVQLAVLGFTVFASFYVGIAHESGVPLSTIFGSL